MIDVGRLGLGEEFGRRRALLEALREDDRVLDEGELVVLGQHCSDTEVAAEEAERELRTFLVLQLLQDRHLGDEFEAVVTGFSGAGVFVSLEKYIIDGMVRCGRSRNTPPAERLPEIVH